MSTCSVVKNFHTQTSSWFFLMVRYFSAILTLICCWWRTGLQKPFNSSWGTVNCRRCFPRANNFLCKYFDRVGQSRQARWWHLVAWNCVFRTLTADVYSWEIEAFSNFSPVFKPVCINRHKNMCIQLQVYLFVSDIGQRRCHS